MIPSDLTPEAISAQLLAGWVFMAGMGLMFVIAAGVAVVDCVRWLIRKIRGNSCM